MLRLSILFTLLLFSKAFVAPSAREASRVSLGMAKQETSRRAWGASVISALGVVALPGEKALAEGGKFSTFQDAACNIQFSVPEAWTETEQSLPDRRRIVLFIDPTGDEVDKTFVFVAFTSIRDDYPSLSSFGTPNEVGQTTVLPRGELVGESTKSELLSAESKNNAYFFDYTVLPVGRTETHYRAVFYLAKGGTGAAGSVLVTLTAQTPEPRYKEMKPLLDQIIDSFGTIS